MQEEFSRFTGYWWCPTKTSTGKHRIAYFEVDEQNVPTVKIQTSGTMSLDTDTYRYPRPGEQNATSYLCVVEFSDDFGVDPVVTRFPILQQNPWIEYVPRAGWTKNGKQYEYYCY